MSRISRMLARRGGTAAAGAALLLGGIGLSALAPAAMAGTVSPSVHCVLPAGQGEGTGPQSMQVELTPANAAPGTQVHAVVTLGAGPVNSTQTLSNVPTTPSIDLAMSGGATGTVTVTGPTVNLNTTSGQPVIIPTYQGDFIVPNSAQGTVNFTPVRTVTKTVVLGGTYTTNCDVVSGGGVVASVNVQGPGSAQPTLSAPIGTVRPGSVLAFAGLGWPSNGATSVTLCGAGGGACVPDPFGNSSVAVDVNGVLTGTAQLTATGVPNGNYVITVTSGTKQATTSITVQAFVPSGPRQLTVAPTSGPLGTVVTFTGSNWNPNKNINIAALDSDQFDLEGFVNITSTPDGTFTAQFTVSSTWTAFLRAREGTNDAAAVIVPFTITTTPPSLVASPVASHRNGVVALTGSNWAPNSTPTAALCDTAGNNCNAASLTNSTLTVNSSGALSGSVKIGGSVAYANYTIKVTAAGSSAITPITVQQRYITLSPDRGPVGTWVTITGKDYANWAWVKIYGINAAGQVTEDYSYAAADGAGNWLTWTQIKDPTTVALVASETFAPSKKAQAAFTVTP
ncbi:hypothetical protein ACPA54_23915 [Uniformispora flossi]|uniref:hypothetical protein n=1 Tax=Uniformispora flossi TaxID=3390723 RepID=UPI003C2E1927